MTSPVMNCTLNLDWLDHIPELVRVDVSTEPYYKMTCQDVTVWIRASQLRELYVRVLAALHEHEHKDAALPTTNKESA